MKSAEVTSLHSSPTTVDRLSLPIVARESSAGNYTPTAPAFREPPSVESARTDSAPGVDEVIRLIRAQTGHDFSAYKRVAISRCISLRMQALRVQSVAEYTLLLEKSPAEINALVRNLLIGVTRFFRETAAWGDLARTAIPELLARNPKGGLLRAWVPGCSTGEEAYSLAMSFREAIERQPGGARCTVQIIATDIDVAALAFGRAAVFPSAITEDVSPRRLRQFFAPTERGYRLSEEIRDMVIFSTQNVVMDAPFTRLDLISCRNVMILLNRPLQQRLLAVLHGALQSDGVLFLGTSESIGRATALFTPLSAPSRIYRRIEAGTRTLQGHLEASRD